MCRNPARPLRRRRPLLDLTPYLARRVAARWCPLCGAERVRCDYETEDHRPGVCWTCDTCNNSPRQAARLLRRHTP